MVNSRRIAPAIPTFGIVNSDDFQPGTYPKKRLMIRDVFLVRHAKSNWDYPHLRDIERPLNDRGLRDAPRMAKYFADLGLHPDIIISSPAVRALTTAAFFKVELDIEGEDFWVRDQIYEGSASTLLQLIQLLPEGVERPVIFGHNPGFTMFANHFPGGDFMNVPTCGIVHYQADISHWGEFGPGSVKVVAHYFPKEVL